MASMQAAIKLHQKAQADKKKVDTEKQQKLESMSKLCADTCVSVADIMKIISNYLDHHQTKDLIARICPPSKGPKIVTWKTVPCGEWMAKLADLYYDFIDIAQNTKLAQAKLKIAVRKLREDGKVIITNDNKPEDFDDHVDFTIRVVFYFSGSASIAGLPVS